MKRNIALYLVLFLATIAAGLFTRADVLVLPDFVSLYVGDTLWAMMVFWLMCCISPRAKTVFIALLASGFCFAIELSQLYHAPWIDTLRAYKLGGLVLGFSFSYIDLLCYSVGVLAAALLDRWFIGVCRYQPSNN